VGRACVHINTRRKAMAKDLNKVMLTGYLGADPEMRVRHVAQ
jgi:hypothetical protein